MGSTAPPPPSGETVHDFFPFYRQYKDGRVERFVDCPIVPADSSDNPNTGVRSKDVVISPENNVSARIYLPVAVSKGEKLPVLFYIHGGGFVIESAFSSLYHSYLTSLVAEAKVLAVSVEYRLAPEHPLPACFEDSWEALKWVTSHGKSGKGPDPWINDHADFTRIFVAGDSAGGNLAHNTVARASIDGFEEDGVKIEGMILAHPYFGGIGKTDALWEAICCDSSGAEDPRFNPMAHPDILLNMKCSKVLILTAEKDFIRERGIFYYEALKKSGWSGQVEFMESDGEEHVFHLKKPDRDNAAILMKKVVSFFKE